MSAGTTGRPDADLDWESAVNEREDRNTRSVWPWIIGLIVLVLVVWVIAEVVAIGRHP